MPHLFKKFTLVEFVVVGVIVAGVVFILLATIPPKVYKPALVALTRQELTIGRQKIQEFRVAKARYPESLAELEGFIGETGELGFAGGRFVEQISSSMGNSTEHRALDGTGGWYYGKDTGELKVNLTGQVNSYFRVYRASDGSQRPCDW